MNNIFVWTFSDVVVLAFIIAVLIMFGVAFVMDTIQGWWRKWKNRGKNARSNG